MKYVGSKAKLAKYIVPIIQEYIDKTGADFYIESFVGGANIIDKIKCYKKYGSDVDNIPIDILTHFTKHPTDLDCLPKNLTKEQYYYVRDNKKEFQDWYRSAVLLFGSYNSRVYGGCYGAVAKTKNGKVRNYYQEAINNFRKQIPLLKDINFQRLDYRQLFTNYDTHCSLIFRKFVMYCDPPYKNSIGYSTIFNHEEFWNWVREISKNGNPVLVSEYEAPDDFECIWSMPIKTHMNNRNKINKVEKLFIYKGENRWKK